MDLTWFKDTCSKCGKEETPDCEFKVCATCKKKDMDPHAYCCQECFEADWKNHKKVHSQFGKKSEKQQSSPRLNFAISRFLQFAGSNETPRIMKLHEAIVSYKFKTASRICRKEFLENPQNPLLFLSQGIIELEQNKNGEKASRLLQHGVECFIHSIWEKPVELKDFIVLFEIHLLIKRTQHTGPAFTADWILNDKKFMALWDFLKSAAYALLDTEIANEDQRELIYNLLYDMEYFNICLRFGTIHKGRLEKTEQRSNHDLAIATVSKLSILSLFEKSAALFEEYVAPFLEIVLLLDPSIKTDEKKNSPFYDGEWVFAKDLVSTQGQLLNHHPGLVEGDSLDEKGRVAVRFEENGQLKYLKPANLESASQSNIKAALLMFKPLSYQWQFVKHDLQHSSMST
ncbi:predicted protein [Chaetoceros tenuissimus]|uniref:Uncharacterized protein n=1 Tax=Chaetoceros tenuissimus TaxID=426638 RepID=A0AAD3D487_9STRA|nr:predicted protein [Chaetoceros tenuissimus]